MAVDQSLEEASNRILAGEVIGYPTETFFGLAAMPASHAAVERLLDLKDRSLSAGIPLIIADGTIVERLIGQEPELVRSSRRLLQEKFWPGPLTLVVRVADSARSTFSPGVFGPDDSLAVRVSSCSTACLLAAACGGMITATSANPKSLPPASASFEVKKYFPEMFVLERLPADPVQGHELASTILDVRCQPLRVLRSGAIPEAQLKAVLGARAEQLFR